MRGFLSVPLVAAFGSVCLFGLGCGTGNNFTVFPPGHKLLPQARALSQSNQSASYDTVELPRELNKQVAPLWVVEPGDVLLAQPASLDSPIRLPGDQTVPPDGVIRLGRYGQVLVVGKTIEQIEVEVNKLIQAHTTEAGPIVVRLVMRDSKVYYVLGEVNSPGVFSLKGRETVLDALLAAGGMTTNANKRSVILARPTGELKLDECRIVLPVRYNAIVQLGDTTTNYQIRAGDRIFVPTRHFFDDVFHWLVPEN